MERSRFGCQRHLSIAFDIDWRSKKTIDFAVKHNKPWLHLHHGGNSPEVALVKLIQEHRIKILNVAGPRASKEPEVGAFVKRVLETTFSP